MTTKTSTMSSTLPRPTHHAWGALPVGDRLSWPICRGSSLSQHIPSTGAKDAVDVLCHLIDALDGKDRPGFLRCFDSNAYERDEQAGYTLSGAGSIAEAMWAMGELFPRVEATVKPVGLSSTVAELEVVWCDDGADPRSPTSELIGVKSTLGLDRTVVVVNEGKIKSIRHTHSWR